MRRTPALIVGGGPAGAAAAIALARAGVETQLLERGSGQDEKVCGGFLSASAISALNELGIDIEGMGARPIHCVRLIAQDRRAALPLPFAAAGLSRRTLDSALLGAAARSGAEIRANTSAAMVYPACRIVRTRDEDLIQCEGLFIASGKHEVRGSARVGTRGYSSSVGLRTQLPRRASLETALEGCVELHLFDEGYAGLLLQEDGSCNLCLSVSQSRMSLAGKGRTMLQDLLAECPLLAERIGPDLPATWQAIAGVPYGWNTDQTFGGVFRLGDQAGVIASLAGDGVGLALLSGICGAKAFIREGPDAAASWQRRFRRSVALPVGLSEFLRKAAGRSVSRTLLMQLAVHAPTIASLAAASTRIGAR
jgi:menaquinone-9 beta-reductase